MAAFGKETPLDVHSWLKKLKLPQYASIFEENDIDERLLVELGEDELTSLGITNAFHKKKILVGIEVLREGINTPRLITVDFFVRLIL
jgi:hypothetical protein